MKLQFSLATLLICMSVLAVVVAVGMKVPVQDIEVSWVQKPYPLPAGDIHKVQHSKNNMWEVTAGIKRSPNAAELAVRLAWSWPLAIAATLGVLWAIRRLKSRRHTEPPVG
jgi:hypothetical protein